MQEPITVLIIARCSSHFDVPSQDWEIIENVGEKKAQERSSLFRYVW